ncbi:MAG: hypothetical protein ACI4DS_06145 [Eubacterium sp.]
MLNGDKVILMTKLALYEQNEGKKTIKMSKYFKGDYVGIQLVKSFFAITLAYIFAVAIVIAYKAGYIIDNLTNIDFIKYGKIFIVIYVAVLLIYMMITFIASTYKFKTIRKSLKVYNGCLKALLKMQDAEAMSIEERELGGAGEDDGTFSF